MLEAFVIGVITAIVVLYFAAKRAVTVADLDIANGKVTVVRGGIAPPVLADLRDIAARPPISRARVGIVRASGRAEVRISGSIPADQGQRIRNVIGSVPLARLMNARRK